MKLIGPNTLAQAAVPDIFANVPDDYHQKNLDLFYSNALYIHKTLKSAPGLTPVMPSATMYFMVSWTLGSGSAQKPVNHSLFPPSLPLSFSSPLFSSPHPSCQVLIDMDHFPEFANDVIFTKALVTEQSVFCLPGPVSQSVSHRDRLTNDWQLH